MNFKFEEKGTYTLDEVQAIINDYKGQVDSLVSDKDNVIAGLNAKIEGLEDLSKSNHELKIKNLLVTNNLTDDDFDLVYDEDLEKVNNKIARIKELSKATEIDNNYAPSTNRSEDAYNKAITTGDAEGAIKAKLSRIFG